MTCKYFFVKIQPIYFELKLLLPILHFARNYGFKTYYTNVLTPTKEFMKIELCYLEF